MSLAPHPVSPKLIPFDDLHRTLDGRVLPGAELTIAPYESDLADHALLAPDRNRDTAHPVWPVMLAVRDMGISVDELCALAVQRPQDTLLIGSCDLEILAPIPIGHRLRTSATVGPVARKQTREGAVLDLLPVRVSVHDLDTGCELAVVTNGYVIKRGNP